MNPLSWLQWIGAAAVAVLSALAYGLRMGKRSEKAKQDSDTLDAIRRKKDIENEVARTDRDDINDRLRRP